MASGGVLKVYRPLFPPEGVEEGGGGKGVGVVVVDGSPRGALVHKGAAWWSPHLVYALHRLVRVWDEGTVAVQELCAHKGPTQT